LSDEFGVVFTKKETISLLSFYQFFSGIFLTHITGNTVSKNVVKKFSIKPVLIDVCIAILFLNKAAHSVVILWMEN
jgi:hypothetical protein